MAATKLDNRIEHAGLCLAAAAARLDVLVDHPRPGTRKTAEEDDRIPANVSGNECAIAAGEFANEVEAMNQ